MSDRIYKATLSQSQGREGWSVIFRHPVLLDRATGKPGRRVRRGLGTKDEKAAAKLVTELNQLLADRLFWEPSSRTTASTRFSPIVVDIFYHDMTPEAVDPFAIRESVFPLPRSSDSNYRRVLFLGTTGSGKTTLVRQLIGTDLRTERFPSTSTAKTTVADTEVVLTAGPFKAVVTFLPRDQVRDYVEESLSVAVLAAHQGASDAEVLRRVLNHVNQRFRLSYLLGSGVGAADNDDVADDASLVPGEASQTDSFDQTNTRKLLESTVRRLRAIAQQHVAGWRAEMQQTAPGQTDSRVLEELFEDALDSRLRDDEEFQRLGDDFMDEIERRFELLTVGQLQKTKQGWPWSWSYETADRKQFIAVVSRFTGNYAPYFGTLLTPIVNGIRVAGPFRPAWQNQQPPLVLFDVEGLGHTPDSAASLPTVLTRRMEDVDAVLLVDNATQPMQAAPVAAMRSLAASGQASKLIVCFTHFDGVVGDNLPTFTAKEHHVLASAENALTAIGEELGSFAERALRRRLESACFFLANLQQPLTDVTKAERRTIDQLKRLLSTFDGITARQAPARARPVYDRLNLALASRKAAEEFHAAWRARLGLNVKFGISKEHWARIKALCRRLAEGWDDQYLHLKPLADLHEQLQESIYRFIQNPIAWTGPEPSEDEKQRIFDRLAQLISARLLTIIERRMKSEVIREWQRAYAMSGTGSTFGRAKVMAVDIYETAAPIPDVAPTPDQNKFLYEIIEAVEAAAAELDVMLR